VGFGQYHDEVSRSGGNISQQVLATANEVIE
jgi:hypothetical protein